MTFDKALQHMWNGKTVRRDNDRIPVRIVYHDDKPCLESLVGHDALDVELWGPCDLLNSEDILAYDWEVIT